MHQLKEFRRKFRGFESLEIISNEILWNIGMKLLKSYEMVSYVPHSIEKQTLPPSLSLYTLSNSWKIYVFYFLWNIQSRVQLSNWVLTSNNMIFFAKFNQILIKFIVWIWIPKYHSKFHSGFCCSSKPQNFMVFHWKKNLD